MIRATLPVSSNLISGLDVVLFDVIVVTLTFHLLMSLFKARKLTLLTRHPDLRDPLLVTSITPFSLATVGHRRLGRVLALISLLTVLLATLTGFGITGVTNRRFDDGHLMQVMTYAAPRSLDRFDELLRAGAPGQNWHISGAAHMFSSSERCRLSDGRTVRYYAAAMEVAVADKFYELGGEMPPFECLTPGKFEEAPLYTRRENSATGVPWCHPGTVARVEQGAVYNLTGVELKTFRLRMTARECFDEGVGAVLFCTEALQVSCVYAVARRLKANVTGAVTLGKAPRVGEELAGELEFATVVSGAAGAATPGDMEALLRGTSAVLATWLSPHLSSALAVARMGARRGVVRRAVGTREETELGALFFGPAAALLAQLAVLAVALPCLRARAARRVNVAADEKGLMRLVRGALRAEGDGRPGGPAGGEEERCAVADGGAASGAP